MNRDTALALSQLNNKFYRDNHRSFSQTRSRGWDGWERVCKHMVCGPVPYRLLDLACGNLRFERYCLCEVAGISFSFDAIDSCDELAQSDIDVRYRHLDIIESLLGGSSLVEEQDRSRYDMAVSFGFMHHIPGEELRMRFVEELLGAVKPAGLIALSFWQFANDDKLLARAEKTTETGLSKYGFELDDGDFLLGWNGREGALRYCHSFNEEEVSRLVSAVDAACTLVDRYHADGRGGKLNEYIVLRRRN